MRILFLSILLTHHLSNADHKHLSMRQIGKGCLEKGREGIVGGVPGPKGWVLPHPCCPGLKDREAISVCGTPYGGGYKYSCIACGDGKCDSKNESSCNCAEDCK
jgi:hypothetical protein